MTRRLLLVAGGSTPGGGGGGGPLPPDPTLTEWRGVTQMVGTNQNFSPVGVGGKTFRNGFRMGTDATGLTFTWTAHIQGLFDAPFTVTGVTYEGPDGTLIPLTFDGAPGFALDDNQWIESDQLDVTLNEADVFYLRVFCPEQPRVPESSGISTTYMTGDHRTGTWTPGAGVTGGGPVPFVLGHARADTECPAMIGDSIAAQGLDGNYGWWRTVMGTDPAMSFGRNATIFPSAPDGRTADLLRGVTHIISEYGVNDMGSSSTTDISGLWANARASYAMYDADNPGIPIWQTTCTPVVDTSDGGTTLAGQTPHGNTRLTWNAWLRDGAPINPTTKANIAVGAAGLRAGDDGHPLAGIVDTAAYTEHGGAAAPANKWRVDLGSLSSDGTHPTNLGMSQMALATTAWRAGHGLGYTPSDPMPGGGGGGGSWTPASIASLAVWLDPSDAATLTTVDGKVSQIADKSGHGRHVAQATDTLRPLTGTLNGKTALSYTDGLQALEWAGVAAAPLGTTQTVLMVTTTTANGSGTYLLNTTNGTDLSSSLALIANFASRAFEFISEGVRFTIAETGSGHHVVGYRRDGTAHQGRYDGAASGSGTGSTNRNTYAYRLGGYLANVNGHMGKIGEVLMFDTALSPTDLAAAEAYLKAKWGTP